MLAKPRSIHLQMTHVHAAETRSAVAAASRYIRDCRISDPDDLRSIDRALQYIRDTGRYHHDDSRVVATAFVSRGSHSRQTVWHQIDQAFRTKTGEYSRRGGNNAKKGHDFKSAGTPRLAIFADGTLPYDVSEEAKINIATTFAHVLVDTYGCAVEIALHKKHGVIDHAHWLISTRVVDESGVGPVIRAMNGVASKATGKTVDGLRKAGFAEFCRSEFARILTDATGERYDARSFARQGRGDVPTQWVPRHEYEKQQAARLAQRVTMKARRETSSPSETILAAHSTLKLPAPVERLTLPRSDRAVTRSPLGQMASALTSASSKASLPHVTNSFAPRASAGPDLTGLSDDETAEAIRKTVDRDLKADGEDFRREQALLDAQRYRGAPVPQWHVPDETGIGRGASPRKAAMTNDRDQPVTRPSADNATHNSTLSHLDMVAAQDEEAAAHRRKEKRLLRMALDAAKTMASPGTLDRANERGGDQSTGRVQSASPNTREKRQASKTFHQPQPTADIASAVRKGPPPEAGNKFGSDSPAERFLSASSPGEISAREMTKEIDKPPPVFPEVLHNDTNIVAVKNSLSPTLESTQERERDQAGKRRSASSNEVAERQTPEKIDRPQVIAPADLRVAAIAAATLTRTMPDTLSAIAHMSPEEFKREVAAYIANYDRSPNRAKLKRWLIERIRRSGDPVLIAMITNDDNGISTQGARGTLAQRSQKEDTKSKTPNGRSDDFEL